MIYLPFLVLTQIQNPHLIHRILPQPPMTALSDYQQFMPWDIMEITPLPGIFLHLAIVLLCLWLGLVVLRFPIFDLSFFLWVGASLSLLLLLGVPRPKL
jgi:hypothetical protein